jgi:hypothetical protein
MNQRRAVFNAVCEVKGTQKFNGPVELSEEEHGQVSRRLFGQFKSGEISFRAQANFLEDKRLTNYICRLIESRLKMDRRLNGKIEYRPKSTEDKHLWRLRTILATTRDPELRAELQELIDYRIDMLTRSSIDIKVLPMQLRESLLECRKSKLNK